MEIKTHNLEEVIGQELVDFEIVKDGPVDGDAIVLHFSNGKELLIYINYSDGPGTLCLEGD